MTTESTIQIYLGFSLSLSFSMIFCWNMNFLIFFL